MAAPARPAARPSWGLVLLLAPLTAVLVAAQQDAPRPHIIMILADDLVSGT